MRRGKRAPHLVAQFLRNSPGMQAAILADLATRYPDLTNMKWTLPGDSTIYSGTWLLARAQSHGWNWSPQNLRAVKTGASISTGKSTWTRHA